MTIWSGFEQVGLIFVNERVVRSALLFLLSLVPARGAAPDGYTPSRITPPPVSREFRGAWVAAVNNIDWPSKPALTTRQQKDELLTILDKCQRLKLNVVILQVRPACDALYASKLEPWSEYLTGTQGKAPNPFWDPLQFAVEQAHARGLELHAWFNPFRARHSSGARISSADHVSRKSPALVKTYGTHLWLDPGLPEVHDYSARVMLDVVRRYDIDGVHIDDYFYPYPEKDAAQKDIPFPDWTSWLAYQRSGGKLTRDAWRRDNVNRFIQRIYREIHAAKPWVKVGVSPFGIYRPGYPAQIKGFDQYASLYADPRLWLVNGWLDYLAPQLYWRIDAPAQSFPVLLKWWMENNPKHRVIAAGINTTAIGPTGRSAARDAGGKDWPTKEITRQIEISRAQGAGHIHWNMSALLRNKGSVNEALRGEYDQPALPPALEGGATKPSAPTLTARVTLNGTEFHCEVERGADVRFVIVQVRNRDDAWHTQITAGKSFTQELKPSPMVVAARSVDKFGNVSEARVIERKVNADRR